MVLVNGVNKSMEELQEIKNDPKVRLIEVKPNEFKTLTLMKG